jgi:nucleoid DNA-binding protein
MPIGGEGIVNKKELVQRAARILRINNYKKSVHLPKQTMTVTLGDRSTSFSIKPLDKDVIYTVDDVEVVLDAVLTAIVEGMKNGEETSLFGFGVFQPKLWTGRRVRRVDTGELDMIKERYIPHFESGKDLRLAMAVYNARLEEGSNPFYVDDDPDMDGDPDEIDEPLTEGDAHA